MRETTSLRALAPWCIVTAGWIAGSVALHAAVPPAGQAAPLWVGSAPGRLAECGLWAGLGVLLSALANAARMHARGPSPDQATAFSSAGELLAALGALTLLRLGLEIVARLVPGSGWLVVEPAALAAGTGIPFAFTLGLDGRTGVQAARGMARIAGQGPARLRDGLRRFLAATFEPSE